MRGVLFLQGAGPRVQAQWPSEEIAPRADLGDRLPAGVPVLLYHGAHDAVVPVAHVDLYAATIPRARVH